MEIDTEMSSDAPEPPTPKHICELSFTSFSDQFHKCSKMKMDDVDEKNSRLFWLATTRDVNKLNEMQTVFQFLRFAQLGPRLNEIRRARFFETWRKGVFYSRWRRLTRKLRHNARRAVMEDAGGRVQYVRTKIAGKLFRSNTDEGAHPGIAAVSDLAGKILPLNILIPRPELPFNDSPRSGRSSPRQSPKGSASGEASPKKKSPRKRSPKRSPSPPRSPVVERGVQLPPYRPEPVKNEEPPALPPIPPPSNTPIFVLVFILALIAGVVTFFMVSPAGVFTDSGINPLEVGNLAANKTLKAPSDDEKSNTEEMEKVNETETENITENNKIEETENETVKQETESENNKTDNNNENNEAENNEAENNEAENNEAENNEAENNEAENNEAENNEAENNEAENNEAENNEDIEKNLETKKDASSEADDVQQ